jgi:hypothetical protein
MNCLKEPWFLKKSENVSSVFFPRAPPRELFSAGSWKVTRLTRRSFPEEIHGVATSSSLNRHTN